MNHKGLYIGTAGWAIPKAFSEKCPSDGSHLQRYSQCFPAVELNTSFYRPHRATTYARWADSVPDDFRFAVKVPRRVTHTKDLNSALAILTTFLKECRHLGPKRGPLLVQFPPRLVFARAPMLQFFDTIRGAFTGDVVCEPRHPSWFTAEVDMLLSEFHIARVAADPGVVAQASIPAGWMDLVYYRLHGSPQLYTSAYTHSFLQSLATRLATELQRGAVVWGIFDNTAQGAAIADAFTTMNLITNL